MFCFVDAEDLQLPDSSQMNAVRDLGFDSRGEATSSKGRRQPFFRRDGLHTIFPSYRFPSGAATKLPRLGYGSSNIQPERGGDFSATSIPSNRAICCKTNRACPSPFFWSRATIDWATSFGRGAVVEPALLARGNSP